MALTSEFLLLVRPDFVVYDEVRKTSDFETFADMRLAGVGLIGVTHANRAIDAVQRLIGRVELGVIPQVVDTVIHIVDGRVREVLELRQTVKVPDGMFQADLARPVIAVSDFRSGREVFELYTYGDQVVVMPVGGASRRDRGPGGRGGRTAPRSRIEGAESAGGGAADGQAPSARVRLQGKMIVIQAPYELSGEPVEVVVDGRPLFEAQVGTKGAVRLARRSPMGRQLEDALRAGAPVALRRA